MFYFSDNFNFKKENFVALYNFLDAHHIEYAYDDKYTQAKKFSLDVPYKRGYESIQADSLLKEKFCDIRLYDVYEQQLFYHCASCKDWKYCHVPTRFDEYFGFIYNNYYEILIKCRNAAIFWIDYWMDKTTSLKIDVGISFGGSLIYSNAFAKVLMAQGIPHYCVEHFFTGNDWYFEKKSEPIPNNSILQNNYYCQHLKNTRFLDSEKTFQKLNASANKNVKQPEYKNLKLDPYYLIIAQVGNDFSLASKNNIFKNSAQFYLQLIIRLLEKTDVHIVVKTHPYEKSKLEDGSITTYNFLKKEIQKISGNAERVTLLENYSLDGLLDGAELVLTLNSQAGLQALQRFKPVACFGGAFYGNKGFTYDYKNIEEFLKQREHIHIDMDMYGKFLTFMDAAFEHLIGNNEEYKISLQFQEVVEKYTKINSKTSVSQGKAKKLPLSVTKKKTQLTSFQRKVRKLIRSPGQFFRDSWLIRNY